MWQVRRGVLLALCTVVHALPALLSGEELGDDLGGLQARRR